MTPEEMYLASQGHYISIKNFFKESSHTIAFEQTNFGYAAIKGNTMLTPAITHLKIGDLELCVENAVLHERIAVIEQEVPIRSHQEETQEIVKNIGTIPIYQTLPDGKEEIIKPNQMMFSFKDDHGFHHGFRIEKPGGLLYVAKALRPDSVEGDSFIIPPNTYQA